MALKQGITKEDIMRRQQEGRSLFEGGVMNYAAEMMDLPTEIVEKAGKENVAEELSAKAGDEDKLVEIPIELLTPSQMNTFRAYPEETFEELKASIESSGLLNPLLVRPAEYCEAYSIEAEFEIIAGEHRYLACKELGIPTVRCAIYKVDDVTASLIIGQTNIQREASEIEVAWNYRNTYDLMKNSHGGDRKSAEYVDGKSSSRDENLIENEKTLDVLAARYGISRPTMHRKIRLTHLCDEALEKYTKGKMTQEQAVQISYGDEDAQHFLLGEYFSSTNKNWIDDGKASAFGSAAKNNKGEVPPDIIRQIMRSEDPEDEGAKKNKDWKYIVPTHLFPPEIKKKERPLYIAEALMYIKTHNIAISIKPDVEREHEPELDL